MPVHAIPAEARAHCHMRYVVGSDASRFLRETQVPVMEKPLDLAELRRRVAETVRPS